MTRVANQRGRKIMKPIDNFLTRRGLLRGGLLLGTAALFARSVFAEELAKTPRTTEGPFYPDKLPLDSDNDLLINGDSKTQAAGDITQLTGKVLDINGKPVKDAVVEIWQVDNKGVYLHTADSGRKQRDTNFQGYGKTTTTDKGEYRFRTVKPVPYPGRTPHIHFRVNIGKKEVLTTQVFVYGHEQNKNDMVLRGIRDPLDRELVLVDFTPIKDTKPGELSAVFNVVIGATPAMP
jgi:protocatechuate 3,4-dioxygenase beta subunit